MRYRLTYRIEREIEPGKGRVTEKAGWDNFSQRTVIVEVPDELHGDRLYDHLEHAAAEREMTSIFERRR